MQAEGFLMIEGQKKMIRLVLHLEKGNKIMWCIYCLKFDQGSQIHIQKTLSGEEIVDLGTHDEESLPGKYVLL